MTQDSPFYYNTRLYSLSPNRYPKGIVDGDTQDHLLDLGFYQFHVERVRLLDVDTHEIHGVSHDSEEYLRGMEEKQFVREWYVEGQESWDGKWPFRILVEEYNHRGSFNRVLGYIRRRSDGEVLNERLLDEFDDVSYGA